MRRARALGAAVLLVGVGRLLSPAAVPVYDGIGAPDQPYRYVAPPSGAPTTPPPSSAQAVTPVTHGTSLYGMTAVTSETGPQFQLYVPPQGFGTTAPRIQVRVDPEAPSDQPTGGRIDGNVYQVKVVADAPVHLTAKAALATLYLRATTGRQPGPTMEYRTAADHPWKALRTLRAGQDIYVSAFPGPGYYALAFVSSAKGAHGGPSPVVLVVLGVVVLLVVVVVVVRLRASS